MVKARMGELVWLRNQLEVWNPPGVIHHSDRGSQYTPAAFTARRAAAGITVPIGHRGDAYDCEENGGVVGSGLTLAMTGRRVPCVDLSARLGGLSTRG